jgi:hypothetical protein
VAFEHAWRRTGVGGPGDHEVVDRAGEQEPVGLRVDVGGDPAGLLFGGEVAREGGGEPRRAVSAVVHLGGERVGQCRVGHDLRGQSDGGGVEDAAGEPGEVVADGGTAGALDQLAACGVEAGQFGVHELQDELASVGEHLVGEPDRAAGLPRERAHRQRRGPVTIDDPACVLQQRRAQLLRRVGGAPTW